MMTTFLMTLEQMVRVVLLLALGFLFNKLRLIPRTAEPVLSRFVTMLFLPSLTFYTNMVECKVDSLVTYSSFVLIGAALCVASMALSYPLSKFLGGKDDYQRGVYRYAITFPNTGAVGTPLILAFFGTAGMFQFGLYQFVPGILTYSWGIMQMQPAHGKTSFWANVRKCINLNFIAMICGMTLGMLGAENWMPGIILDTFQDLGSCYVTVALLLAGFSIADYEFSEVFGDWHVYLFTVLRLIVLPAVVLVILYLFQAPYMLAVMVALTFACPSGMNVVVYPAAYGQDCRAGASMVLISSVCSVFTVPLIYALVQQFFG